MELTDSGLLLPSGTQEAAIAQMLRAHDDQLRLVPQDSDHYGRRIYKVYRWHGPDRDAEFVCGWWNDRLEAFPLSSALVDYVQHLDRNTVGRPPDEDELEAKLRAERRADYLRDAEEIVKEFGPKIDGKTHSPLPRSRSLQLSRQRRRSEDYLLRVPKDFQP